MNRRRLVPVSTSSIDHELDDSEFEADMAFLYGLADALFEFATPAQIAKMAEDARISVTGVAQS